jgi:DNA polymerase elongation subunit (family B)
MPALTPVQKNAERLRERKPPQLGGYEKASQLLRFFYVGAGYDYHAELGTLLNLYGNLDDEDSTPVCVRVHAHDPHFFLKLPEGWGAEQAARLVDALDAGLKEHFRGYATYMKKRCDSKFAELEALVRNLLPPKARATVQQLQQTDLPSFLGQLSSSPHSHPTLATLREKLEWLVRKELPGCAALLRDEVLGVVPEVEKKPKGVDLPESRERPTPDKWKPPVTHHAAYDAATRQVKRVVGHLVDCISMAFDARKTLPPSTAIQAELWQFIACLQRHAASMKEAMELTATILVDEARYEREGILKESHRPDVYTVNALKNLRQLDDLCMELATVAFTPAYTARKRREEELAQLRREHGPSSGKRKRASSAVGMEAFAVNDWADQEDDGALPLEDLHGEQEEEDTFIVGWSIKSAQDVFYYKPPTELDQVLDIRVRHPKMVKKARELLECPEGKRLFGGDSKPQFNAWGKAKPERWKIPPWFKAAELPLPTPVPINKVRPELGKQHFEIYEADVDYTLRHLIDRRLVPSAWFRVEPGKYTTIAKAPASSSRKPSLPSSLKRWSRCALEVQVHVDELRQETAEEWATRVPNFVQAGFDIECETNGKHFPRSDVDPVLQVAVSSSRLHTKEKHKKVVFCLGQAPAPANVDVMLCYENPWEMLDDYRRYFVEVLDPDIWVTHNGNSFDIPYLVNSALHYGMSRWGELGRVAGRNIYFHDTVNKGKKKFYALVEGVVNVDLLRRAQDDQNNTDNTLNGLAKKHLKDTKEELPYAIISALSKSEKGRTRLAKYVMKDADVTLRIVDSLNIITSYLSTSELSRVSIQNAMDRASGYKIEGRFRQECTDVGGIHLLKKTFPKGSKRGEKYPGAIVLKPRSGFYAGIVEGTGKTQTQLLEEEEEKRLAKEEEEAKAKEEEEEERESIYLTSHLDPFSSAVPSGLSHDQRREYKKNLGRYASESSLREERDVRGGSSATKKRQRHAEEERLAKMGDPGCFTPSEPPPEYTDEDRPLEGDTEEESAAKRRRILTRFVRWRAKAVDEFCRKYGYASRGEFTPTLDFASMYPSIMEFHNLCYTTALTNELIARYRLVKGVDYYRVPRFEVRYDPATHKRFVHRDDTDETMPAFCRPEFKKGLIPKMQSEMGQARKKVRAEQAKLVKRMEDLKVQISSATAGGAPKETVAALGKELAEFAFKWLVLEGRQLAIKVWMNAVYGITGDLTSSYYFGWIASTVTHFGRSMILAIKCMAEDEFNPLQGWYFFASVAYGDSVTGNTPIPCRIKGGRDVFYETIDAISQGDWRSYGHEKEEATPLENLEVWTEKGFTSVRRVIRHKTTKNIFHVQTATGMVSVTEDHSLLRPDASEVRPRDVAVGEKLLHADLPMPAYLGKYAGIHPSLQAYMDKEKIPLDLMGEDWQGTRHEYADFVGRSEGDVLFEHLLQSSHDTRRTFLDGIFFPEHYRRHPDGHGLGTVVGNQLLLARLYHLAASVGYRVYLERIQGRVFFRLMDASSPLDDTMITGVWGGVLWPPATTFVYDLETENHHFAAGVGRMVVHNTDSIMPNLVGNITSSQEACTLGYIMAKQITGALFKRPIKLEFEKVIRNLIMTGQKKNYMGAIHELDKAADKPYVFSKGVQQKKRNPCQFMKDTLNKAANMICLDGAVEDATKFVKGRLMQLAERNVPLHELVERQQIQKELGDYGAEKEVEKPKPKAERERCKVDADQGRIYQFFGMPTVLKKRKAGEGDPLPPVAKQKTLAELRAEEMLRESQTVRVVQKAALSPAVQIAKRMSEECPDNPPRAGDIMQYIIVEKDAEAVTRGECAAYPGEVVEKGLVPDVRYYLQKMEKPLSVLFYQPLLAHGLVEDVTEELLTEGITKRGKPSASKKKAETAKMASRGKLAAANRLSEFLLAEKEEEEEEEQEGEKEGKEKSTAEGDDEEFMDELGDKLDKKTEDSLRTRRRNLETREVTRVLFGEIRKKHIQPGLKQDSALTRHVAKGAACFECGQSLLLRGRSSHVNSLCPDCERNTLVELRARRRRREELPAYDEAGLLPPHLKEYMREISEEMQEGRLPAAPTGRRELAALKRLEAAATQRSLDTFKKLVAANEAVWSACEKCMQGEREDAKQCAAYTCEKFGERYKLKTELEKNAASISAVHGVDPSVLQW